MKLLLLGTTGYHPNERRHTACLMIPEAGIVLDAGTAMFRVREHLATDELDIFLTHAHLDHIVGLTFLYDVLHEKNVRRTTLHGEPAKLEAVCTHLFSELLFPVGPPFDCRPLEETTPLAGGGVLTHFPLEHPGGSVGYRLDWPGSSLAYVTDTVARPDAAYIERIRGVDLLVHECYFPDELGHIGPKTGHSHTSAVADVARRAGVGRLVLVHLLPRSSELDPVGLARAQSLFPATQLGTDGLALEF